MEQRGMPASLVSLLVELGASLHGGALLEDYEQHKPVTLGSVKLEAFAREFANAY